ncbi:MAG: hypothetical protein IKW58_01910 [Alphaproteobacteria bacterium]|nr:hypothetical protein [Alphaproteobacteria bacterium]
MKNNTIFTLALALLLTTSITASANTLKPEIETQTPTTLELKHEKFDPKVHFEKMSQKLSKDLNLTKEQEEKAKLLREDGHRKIEPLLKQMKEIRKQMDELRKENMAEFEKILTQEQLEKFNQIKEEGKKRHKMKGKPHKPFSK